LPSPIGFVRVIWPMGRPVRALGSPWNMCAAFDRSQLFSDEGPPIGGVATDLWPEAAWILSGWLVRWN
jgi:hypothetical protein